MGWVKDSFIMQNVMGSDHCPIGIELFSVHPESKMTMSLLSNDSKPHPLSTHHWPSFPGKQSRIDSFFKQSTQVSSDSATSKRIENPIVPTSKIDTLAAKKISTSRVSKPVGKKNVGKGQSTLKAFLMTSEPKRKSQDYSLPASYQENEIISHYFAIPESQNDSFEPHHTATPVNAVKSSQDQSQVWKTLLAPKVVPNCHHSEPCSEFTCNKGPNKGRRFYVCPVETVDQRCDYFEWKIKMAYK